MPPAGRHQLRAQHIGKEEQRRERALTFEKSRSKRYKACSDVEGTVKTDILFNDRQNRRAAADPNRNRFAGLRFGSEEQQNERAMSFAMK